MVSKAEIERAKAAKGRHEKEFMSKPNVVAVGIGVGQQGQLKGQVCIVVSVTKKVPRDQLAPEDMIPEEVEGVPVEVQVTGEIRALE